MPEYHRKTQEGHQEEKQTYPVFMHWRPSAHLGVSLDKIPLVHDSPSFLSSWHFPPSNTWTKQKRPALHWLSSSHGDPTRPVCSEKQKTTNKIKNQNALIMIMYAGKWKVMWLTGTWLNWSQLGQSSPVVSLGKRQCNLPFITKPKQIKLINFNRFILSKFFQKLIAITITGRNVLW